MCTIAHSGSVASSYAFAHHGIPRHVVSCPLQSFWHPINSAHSFSYGSTIGHSFAPSVRTVTPVAHHVQRQAVSEGSVGTNSEKGTTSTVTRSSILEQFPPKDIKIETNEYIGSAYRHIIFDKQGASSSYAVSMDQECTYPSRAAELTPNAERSEDAETPSNQEQPRETPLQRGIAALRAERERQRVEQERFRAHERSLKEAAQARKKDEAERVRAEAEQQRLQARRSRDETARRRNEEKQRAADAIRRSAEEQRRAKEIASEQQRAESERQRADERRARTEAERRAKEKLEEVRQSADEIRRQKAEARQHQQEQHHGAERSKASARRPRAATTASTGTPEHASPRQRDPRARKSQSMQPPYRTSPRPSGSRNETNRRRTPEELERERLQQEREREEIERQREEEERQRLRTEERRAEAANSTRRIAEAGCAWFSILGVAESACLDDVKRAFRKLALLHHPDKGLESCDEVFRIIRDAYQRGLRVAASRN
eukprot:TRINITY_DN28149_c0_g1_i1.p1 TRINITY_DN28149_c0_g1~~TRINITY_DN28149_c0_g1_i1.p1  ORF type:complete len:490 (-),score=46.89 TRINITY_DN28149_c0_g1_i1:249-1718(-)